MLPCPECGRTCTRAGYEKTERVWRHGDVMFYPCYVHCRRPRTKCKEHGIKEVDAPWARKNSRFTLLFEGYAMLVLMDMPLLKASQLLRCNEKALVRILRHWVGRGVKEDDLSDVRGLVIDETSFRRGQSYVTVVIDAQARRVIDVEPGRKEGAVIDFSYKLEAKGGSCEKIETVSSDMSASYKSGIQYCFPNARHTIDKFHVKKLLLDGMDEVRREEQKAHKSRALHIGRRVLMIPGGKQNADQRERVSTLCRDYPKTGRAFRMVQALDTVYASRTYEEAKDRLDALYSWLRKSRLEPMKKAALTLRRNGEEILNIFITESPMQSAKGSTA